MFMIPCLLTKLSHGGEIGGWFRGFTVSWEEVQSYKIPKIKVSLFPTVTISISVDLDWKRFPYYFLAFKMHCFKWYLLESPIHLLIIFLPAEERTYIRSAKDGLRRLLWQQTETFGIIFDGKCAYISWGILHHIFQPYLFFRVHEFLHRILPFDWLLEVSEWYSILIVIIIQFRSL